MARSLHGGVNKSPQPELSDAREIHRDAGSIRRRLAGNACPPPRGTAKQGGGAGTGRRNSMAASSSIVDYTTAHPEFVDGDVHARRHLKRSWVT